MSFSTSCHAFLSAKALLQQWETSFHLLVRVLKAIEGRALAADFVARASLKVRSTNLKSCPRCSVAPKTSAASLFAILCQAPKASSVELLLCSCSQVFHSLLKSFLGPKFGTVPTLFTGWKIEDTLSNKQPPILIMTGRCVAMGVSGSSHTTCTAAEMCGCTKKKSIVEIETEVLQVEPLLQ